MREANPTAIEVKLRLALWDIFTARCALIRHFHFSSL